jgi:LysM repeat protein
MDRTVYYKWVLSLGALLLLSGCQTLQQQQNTKARQQAAVRVTDEKVFRLQAKVESIAQENAQLSRQVQQMQTDVRSYNSAIAQLNIAMRSLDAKQSREMQELIRRVEALLKKSVARRPTAPQRGAGREHVVEKGHTLSTIASAYGTTVKAIKKANNLKSDTIFIGQKLFIPE